MLLGCSTTSTQLAQNCDVRLLEIDPANVGIGDTVTASGHPMTSVWDTAVFVGDDRASLIDVNRLDCEACDECREAESCDACSDCAPCLIECTETCVEQVVFVVPDTSEGVSSVSMYNGHGQSNLLPITIAQSADTGTPDSGLSSDTSSTDTSESTEDTVDSGTSESTDTAESDTLPLDTGGK
jgi:hypothetical protein